MKVRFKIQVRKELQWYPTEHEVTIDAPSMTEGQALMSVWESAHSALLLRAMADTALLPHEGFRVIYETVEHGVEK